MMAATEDKTFSDDSTLQLMEALKNIYRDLYIEKVTLQERLEESSKQTISQQVLVMTEEMTKREPMEEDELKVTANDPNIGILDKLRMIESTLKGHKTILTQMSRDLQTIISSHQLEETMMP
jgi:hypothetical protein